MPLNIQHKTEQTYGTAQICEQQRVQRGAKAIETVTHGRPRNMVRRGMALMVSHVFLSLDIPCVPLTRLTTCLTGIHSPNILQLCEGKPPHRTNALRHRKHIRVRKPRSTLNDTIAMTWTAPLKVSKPASSVIADPDVDSSRGVPLSTSDEATGDVLGEGVKTFARTTALSHHFVDASHSSRSLQDSAKFTRMSRVVLIWWEENFREAQRALMGKSF